MGPDQADVDTAGDLAARTRPVTDRIMAAIMTPAVTSPAGVMRTLRVAAVCSPTVVIKHASCMPSRAPASQRQRQTTRA
jgi:hypothetical protein